MEVRTYAVADRPDVEVRRDGQWYPGVLRQWVRREDGWWADVAWRREPGATFIDAFSAEDVRLVE